MQDSVGLLLRDALSAQRASDPSDSYDEVLRTVIGRAGAERSLCKADIGSLVLWKRITAQARWSTELGLRSDAEVRRRTGETWRLANDTSLSIPEAGQRARMALVELPGLGGTGALASAVLLACAPHRMAVWDRRVGIALDALARRPHSGNGFYGRYLAEACDLADEMGSPTRDSAAVTPRDVDLALYAVAGDPALLNRARSVSE